MYKLSYTAVLQQVDGFGDPDGDKFTFTGAQAINSANPQNADVVTALAGMSTDLTTQIEVGFPLQLNDDSAGDGSGGAG